MNSYGSLAQNARSSQLKSAKVILWILGILNVIVSGFSFMNTEKEVDEEFDKELKKTGASIEMVRALPAADRAKFDAARTEAIGKVKLLYGGGVAVGIIFIGCALAVNRKPVIATVTGLVVYLGINAAVAALDSSLILQGIILKVCIVGGLISAVKAALAVERQERAEQELQGV